MNKQSLDQTKVLLGLSGGVDSTAAALLLKAKGLEVAGLYFDVMGNGTSEGKIQAEKAAKKLEIEFIYKNVAKEFESIVIDDFCSEYINGRTPNPCIVCNPLVKFKTLIDEADKRGIYYVATGHYASIFHDETSDIYFVRQSLNKKKDQSYMLYRLGQEVLSRVIFPLEEIADKDSVRDMVRYENFENADLKDSQEICFISPENNYINYMKDRGYSGSTGLFVDKNGNILGEHGGIVNFTVGQRKGLGMTFGKPMFVIKLDFATNQVVLGSNEDLFDYNLIMSTVAVLGYGNKFPPAYEGMQVWAKIRYTASPAKAKIYSLLDGDTLKISAIFEEKQRAATPGQSVVFYKDDILIGGGIIE